MKKTITLLFLALIVVACKEAPKVNTIQTLELVDLLNGTPKTATMNDVFSDVKKIPLETSEEILIGHMSSVTPYKDYLIVGHDGICSLFDKDGRYIRQIGSKGQGPDEYVSISNIAVEDDLIRIYSTLKILSFTFEGKPVSHFKTPSLRDAIGLADKNLYVGYIPNISGQEDNKLLFFNDEGEEVGTFPYYEKYENPTGIITVMYDECSLFRSEDKLYMKELMNDTIFAINADKTLTPCYALSLGTQGAEPALRYQMTSLADTPTKGKARFNLLGAFGQQSLFLTSGYQLITWNKETSKIARQQIQFSKEDQELFDKEFFTPNSMTPDGKTIISWQSLADIDNDDNPIVILATLK